MSLSTSVTIRIPNEILDAVQIKISEMPQLKNISTVIKESLDLWLNASSLSTVDRCQSDLASNTSSVPYGYGNPTDRPLPDTWQDGYCEAMDAVDALQSLLYEDYNPIIDGIRREMKRIGEPDPDWLIRYREDREESDPGIDPHDDQAWHEHYQVPTVIKRLEQLENAVGVLLRERQKTDDRVVDRPNKNGKGFG